VIGPSLGSPRARKEDRQARTHIIHFPLPLITGVRSPRSPLPFGSTGAGRCAFSLGHRVASGCVVAGQCLPAAAQRGAPTHATFDPARKHYTRRGGVVFRRRHCPLQRGLVCRNLHGRQAALQGCAFWWGGLHAGVGGACRGWQASTAAARVKRMMTSEYGDAQAAGVG